MFRGTFATQRRGGQGQNALDLHVKNTSNTNVVCWGGRLWTLFEAGQPYRLNPRTLETEGMETLDGQLRVGMPFDMGSPAANRALGSFLTGTQERLGNAHFMPPELLAAGMWWGLCAAYTLLDRALLQAEIGLCVWLVQEGMR